MLGCTDIKLKKRFYLIMTFFETETFYFLKAGGAFYFYLFDFYSEIRSRAKKSA